MDLARMTWGSMGSFCGLEYLSHLAQGFNPLSKKKKNISRKKISTSWFKASMHPALATMETWPVSLS